MTSIGYRIMLIESFLELEILAHCICDIRWLDCKRNGNISLLKNIVHLEVTHHTALPELLNFNRELCLLIKIPLTPEHALYAVLYGVGQVQVLLTVGVIQLLIHPKLVILNFPFTSFSLNTG